MLILTETETIYVGTSLPPVSPVPVLRYQVTKRLLASLDMEDVAYLFNNEWETGRPCWMGAREWKRRENRRRRK